MRRAVSLIPAILLLLTSLLAQGTAPAPLTLISRDTRRTVPTASVNGQEMIALDEVASIFQVTVREDPLARGLTLTYRGRSVILSTDQPMASVNGRVVALPAAPGRVGNRWFVPLDFLTRALALVYDGRIELRRPSRLLLVGDVRVPRITARIDAAGPPTRATVDITPAAPVSVTTDAGRITARIDADALDIAPAEAGGLIAGIRAGEQPGTLVILLDERARGARAVPSEANGTTRIGVEINAAAADTPAPVAAAPAAPAAPPPPPAFGSRPVLQTIVIDPGHGGDDAGVRGAGGAVEKELTLALARRVRGLVETRLGVRVVLTRDDDRLVTLDERASVANNNKADLFLSLHFNAAPSAEPGGAEVLTFSLDDSDEAQRAARAPTTLLPVIGGVSRAVEVVNWDMAQARYLTESAAFAGLLAEDLSAQIPMSPHGRRQAPLRVLSSVNMPAALVEMAYLTNPGQERLARSDAYQTSVAQAVYNAVIRFRSYLEDRRTR